MIRDFNVEWLQKKIYIPIGSWSGTSQIKATPTGLGSWGAAATTQMQAGAIGNYGAMPLVAADAHNHLMMIPYDLDRRKQVRFRLLWSATTAAQAQTFTLTYALHNLPSGALRASVGSASATPGATATGIITAAASALDTPIPATTSTGVNLLELTDVGIINAGSAAATPLTDQSYIIGIKVVITATAGTAVLYGIEMQYTQRKTAGPRRNLRGGVRLDDHLGTKWTDNRQEGVVAN